MATRSRTASTPAKKTVASRRPAAPAKKAAAPAKKTAPAKKAPAKKPIVEQPKELPKTAPTKPKLQAHDVLRAHLDMVRAQQVFAELHKEYWETYGEAVDLAVDHVKAVQALDAPKQSGPKRKDGPVRHAMVEEEDRVIGETFDREELETQYSLPQLRALFKDLVEKDERLEPTLKKVEILSQLEENGYFREEVDADSDEADDEEEEALGAEDEDEEFDDEEDSDDADDDSEDDDEDDDEEEDDGDVLTAELLDSYNLAELREVAEENNVPFKGKKEAALRAELKAMLPDEDEDEEEDDEDEEGEDEGGWLTVEDLAEMTLEDLLKIEAQCEDDAPASVKKNAAKLRKWLEPYVGADDEEDDDED